MSSKSTSRDRRLDQRFSFFRRIHYNVSGRRQQGLVQNVSRSGMRLLCARSAVPVGTFVLVTLPRLPASDGTRGDGAQPAIQLKGHVTWQRARAIGVRFVNPPKTLTRHLSALLRRSGSAGSGARRTTHPVLASAEVALGEATDNGSTDAPSTTQGQGDKRIIWG